MKPEIELRFLTPEELRNARDIDYRYEHVSDDNFGFADPKKNRIFVRAGLDADLTKYLIDHELSHLFELEGTHEDEHGIRHKGGFWKAAVPIVASILGAAILGPVGGALGGSLLGGGLGTAVGAGLGAGAGSFGGQIGGTYATGGKPDWLGAGIGAAGAGVSSGVGSYLSGFKPLSGIRQGGMGPITVTGPSDVGQAWGSLASSVAQTPGMTGLISRGAGLGTTTGLGMLTSPSSYGGMFQPNPMGPTGGGRVPLPRSPFGWGQEGAMGGDKGTGGRGGMDLPGGKGLQQAGIEMGASSTLPDGAQASNTGQQSYYNPLKSIGFQTGALRF